MRISAILLAAVLFPLTAPAKDRAYQDAVLVDFQTVMSGKQCPTSANTTGTVNATTTNLGSAADTSGTINATSTASTSCVNTRRSVYRISAGGHVYTLEPYVGAGRIATAMIPIAGPAYLIATKKNSVLYGLLPGTHVLVRSEEGGAFYVKVGKKESRYKLTGAN